MAETTEYGAVKLKSTHSKAVPMATGEDQANNASAELPLTEYKAAEQLPSDTPET